MNPQQQIPDHEMRKALETLVNQANDDIGRGSEAKFLYSRIMDVLQGAAE